MKVSDLCFIEYFFLYSIDFKFHYGFLREREYDYKILKEREDEIIRYGYTEAVGYPFEPKLGFFGRRYGRQSPWPHARESHPRQCKKSTDGWHGTWLKYGGAWF